MRLFLFASSLLLLASTAYAQDEGVVVDLADASHKNIAPSEAPVPRPAVKLSREILSRLWLDFGKANGANILPVQPKPEHERVADKKFWLVAGSTMATSILVVKATEHCRGTVGIEHCMGHYGEFKAIQGVQIGLSTFLTGMGYLWKRDDQRGGVKHSQWWIFPVGVAAWNGTNAVQQYSKHCTRGRVFNGEQCE
jgi:hypothetical protein